MFKFCYPSYVTHLRPTHGCGPWETGKKGNGGGAIGGNGGDGKFNGGAIGNSICIGSILLILLLLQQLNF